MATGLTVTDAITEMAATLVLLLALVSGLSAGRE